eukprot:TRINITY_DN64532_c0_g1_i2.p1 TRINITY_DN64532_c0_g1~~TRINITY_DN64532_c0_g1_i2.p1  ORF type:complete len:516 (-),score=19.61 TRINITY_DN64532_c0_g1_i2:46-1593(-)
MMMFLTLFLLNFYSSFSSELSCSVNYEDRLDCGISGTTQEECESKKCCWSPTTSNQNPYLGKLNSGDVPWCFYEKGVTPSPTPEPTTCFLLSDDDSSAPFSSSEVAKFREYYLDNINIEGKGGVVVAPYYDTPDAFYYYHWMRDAALTMRSIQETTSHDNYKNDMNAYANFVLNTQSQNDPNGYDIRTEPKFNLPNGDVFEGEWCRQQNDGPGLTATALIMYANTLISNDNFDFIKKHLWRVEDDKITGAIKYDLDYIVNNYNSSTCDLWEEFTSSDMFWNRITMKKAMILGADFATKMGDDETAALYTSTAEAINSTLYNNHWDGKAIYEAEGRTYDGAVIVGFNVGYDKSDNLFYPTSYEVASTIKQYNLLFCNEYTINTKDTTNNIPGVLYGRYGGDTYAGGNPWVLTTAALANVFYRGAIYIKENGLPDSNALNVWKDVFQMSSTSKINADTFLNAGDSVMQRIRYHVIADEYHLAEQIDRNTGVQMSAEDLTWSYSEVLNAMKSRELATK